jgi:hypothetical protein
MPATTPPKKVTYVANRGDPKRMGYSESIPVAPGFNAIRVLARDADDRIGSAALVVKRN